MSSCYVHFPFCDHICFYCDFYRMVTNDQQKQNWLNSILKELKTIPSTFDTLYFGGGTPSSLDTSMIEEISKHFHDISEWTIECNPDSLDEDKLTSYASMGINRVSLGVQSFQDKLLKNIGRKHSSIEAIDSIQSIHHAGITNISIDLIYALPNQTMYDLKKDIEVFLSLDIPHLSIYSLQIEENSIFGKQNIKPIDEDLEADMYEYICATMKEHGYEHYEISSFCKPGFYSKHNLTYWNDSDFIGIGCGASGREAGRRYDKTKNLEEYINDPQRKYWIESDDQAFEAIMMCLRTQFGLDIKQWNSKYNKDFLKQYRSVLSKYASYIEINDVSCIVNEKGRMILNEILVDFLELS